MVNPALVASVACLVPALGLLWLLLRRYEGYFDDRRLFFTLAVGLFVGLVVSFFENVLFRFNAPNFVAATSVPYALGYFVAGYALLETLAKLVLLGSARFRKRKDTPYYGAALGIGLGATLGIQNIALGMERTGLSDRAVDGAWLSAFGLLLVLHLGALAAHAAAGVWVGKGAAEGRLWKGLLWGSLVQAPSLLFRFFPVGGKEVVFEMALLSLAFGLAVAFWTQRKVLDAIVPPEIRDQVRRERRRELRRQGRDGQF